MMIRIRLLTLLAALVVLGIVSRLRPLGWYVYDKSLGDVLYASAAYLSLAVVFIRQPPWRVAIAALAFCLAIENFKLTGIPANLNQFLVSRWLLGSTFSWHNIWCYTVGITWVYLFDIWILRRKCSRRRVR